MKENGSRMIPEEVIMSKIYQVRGVKVIAESDITGNTDRFPQDLSYLPYGLYFASIVHESFRDTGSIFRRKKIAENRYGFTSYSP